MSDQTTPEPFGELLLHHRQTARMTRAALAERANVSTTTITLIERGKRAATSEEIQKFYEALNICQTTRKGEIMRRLISMMFFALAMVLSACGEEPEPDALPAIPSPAAPVQNSPRPSDEPCRKLRLGLGEICPPAGVLLVENAQPRVLEWWDRAVTIETQVAEVPQMIWWLSDNDGTEPSVVKRIAIVPPDAFRMNWKSITIPHGINEIEIPLAR